MLRTKFPGRPWHIITPLLFVTGEGKTKRLALVNLRLKIEKLSGKVAFMLGATRKGGMYVDE